MHKKITIILVSIVFGVLIIILSSRLFSIEYWIGDYKISFDKNLSTVRIYEYRGDSEVEIPTRIGPFKVGYITDDTFKANDKITYIYIPSDHDPAVPVIITNCPNLKKVEFDEGTTVINIRIFECDNLEELVIPEGVTEIVGCVLSCSKLEDISFPGSLRAASKNDFMDTKFVRVHENEKYFMVGDGVLFYNGDYDQDIVIPEGTKCFDDYIFPGDALPKRNIYIPDTVTSLRIQVYTNDTAFFGDGKFENLINLDCNYEGMNGTIVAPANSYMEQYCKENGYRFRVMTPEEEEEWRELTEAAASEITYQQ